MHTQWFLCEIESSPENERTRLKPTDNLAVRYPDTFVGGFSAVFAGDRAVELNEQGEGQWYVWLPIIPRVGNTIQFDGWQVQVSRVTLMADWAGRNGVQENLFVSARIAIRDDVVPSLTDASFSIETVDNEASHKWEDYARRGNDLQYYAWELRHKNYEGTSHGGETHFYRWHTRIRPMAGDVIVVNGRGWKGAAVALASANESIDGWLHISAVANDSSRST